MGTSTYRAVQVTAPGKVELVDRELKAPPKGDVRIRVEACGVCHSDALTIEGQFPGISYPRIPGHEIAGVIDAVGSDVPNWKPGVRVGVGWNGGYCGYCDHCRRGEFFACENGQITGVTFDGGYAEYVTVPASAVARMPNELPATDAAPLLCAGLTTFNALRNSSARPGDVVAVVGVGGLGHLAIQYASKMGFRTVGVCARKGQGAAGPRIGRDGVHRQPGQRPRGGTPTVGRRESYFGHDDQRRGDERRARRPGHWRRADHDRGGEFHASLAHVSADGQPFGQRLVCGDIDRLARYAGV